MEKLSQTAQVELTDCGTVPKEAMSTVYVGGDYLEVVTPRKAQANLSRYRRCSKEEYMDLVTGELCNYTSHTTDGSERAPNGRCFSELARILSANFKGSTSELHITLTAASDSSADLDTLHGTFRKFWKNFHYRYPKCEYVAIAEPHKSGRYHFHLLVKDREGNDCRGCGYPNGIKQIGSRPDFHNAEYLFPCAKVPRSGRSGQAGCGTQFLI